MEKPKSRYLKVLGPDYLFCRNTKQAPVSSPDAKSLESTVYRCLFLCLNNGFLFTVRSKFSLKRETASSSET